MEEEAELGSDNELNDHLKKAINRQDKGEKEEEEEEEGEGDLVDLIEEEEV